MSERRGARSRDQEVRLEAILTAWSRVLEREEAQGGLIDDRLALKKGLQIKGNRLMLAQEVFERLKLAVSQGNQVPLAVSFPMVVAGGTSARRRLMPVFHCGIAGVLEGPFQEAGWDLTELPFQVVAGTVNQLCTWVDQPLSVIEEESGLLPFLKALYGQDLSTAEEFLGAKLPAQTTRVIARPFLYRPVGSPFTKNLRRDFHDLQTKVGGIGLISRPLVREFFFGERPVEPPRGIALGLYPTHVPSEEQSKLLEELASPVHTLTALVGRAGCGKTTACAHLVAGQIVRRAVRLAEGRNDQSNLTVVLTPTNQALASFASGLTAEGKSPVSLLLFGSRQSIKENAVTELRSAADRIEATRYDELAHAESRDAVRVWARHLTDWEEKRIPPHKIMEYAVRAGDLFSEWMDLRQEIEPMEDELMALQEIAAALDSAGNWNDLQWQIAELSAKLRPLESRGNVLWAAQRKACESFPKSPPGVRFDHPRMDTLVPAMHVALFGAAQSLLHHEVLARKGLVIHALRLYADLLDPSRGRETALFRLLSGDPHRFFQALSLVFPVWGSTTASVRNMLPFTDVLIDLLILDEGAATLAHHAFPAMARARRGLVVGDPAQLRPVCELPTDWVERFRKETFGAGKVLGGEDVVRYDPTATDHVTAFHRAMGAGLEGSPEGRPTVLREHYRCQAPIGELARKLAAPELVIKTAPKPSPLGKHHLILVDVRGSVQSGVNKGEIGAVEWLLEHEVLPAVLAKDDPSKARAAVGVLSPFRNQAGALRKRLGGRWDLFKGADMVGTVHAFQGGEKRILILSTRVDGEDQGGLRFLNSSGHLLYTAVTRACEVLVVVGSLPALEQGGEYTRMLVEHIREHGEIREFRDSSPEQRSA